MHSVRATSQPTCYGATSLHAARDTANSSGAAGCGAAAVLCLQIVVQNFYICITSPSSANYSVAAGFHLAAARSRCSSFGSTRGMWYRKFARRLWCGISACRTWCRTFTFASNHSRLQPAWLQYAFSWLQYARSGFLRYLRPVVQ